MLSDVWVASSYASPSSLSSSARRRLRARRCQYVVDVCRTEPQQAQKQSAGTLKGVGRGRKERLVFHSLPFIASEVRYPAVLLLDDMIVSDFPWCVLPFYASADDVPCDVEFDVLGADRVADFQVYAHDVEPILQWSSIPALDVEFTSLSSPEVPGLDVEPILPSILLSSVILQSIPDVSVQEVEPILPWSPEVLVQNVELGLLSSLEVPAHDVERVLPSSPEVAVVDPDLEAAVFAALGVGVPLAASSACCVVPGGTQSQHVIFLGDDNVGQGVLCAESCEVRAVCVSFQGISPISEDVPLVFADAGDVCAEVCASIAVECPVSDPRLCSGAVADVQVRPLLDPIGVPSIEEYEDDDYFEDEVEEVAELCSGLVHVDADVDVLPSFDADAASNASEGCRCDVEKVEVEAKATLPMKVDSGVSSSSVAENFVAARLSGRCSDCPVFRGYQSFDLVLSGVTCSCSLCADFEEFGMGILNRCDKLGVSADCSDSDLHNFEMGVCLALANSDGFTEGSSGLLMISRSESYCFLVAQLIGGAVGQVMRMLADCPRTNEGYAKRSKIWEFGVQAVCDNILDCMRQLRVVVAENGGTEGTT